MRIVIEVDRDERRLVIRNDVAHGARGGFLQ